MDYRFALKCWQDQAGSEDAKINVFVNGSQVVTEGVVSATSVDSPTIINWESTGIDAPASDTSVSIRVQLANNHYVDESEDRNVYVGGIGYIDKNDGSSYKIRKLPDDFSPPGVAPVSETTVSDFTDFGNYVTYELATAVTGDQIPTDFWNRDGNSDQFYTIPVYGGDDGVTITQPLKITASTCVMATE